MKRERLSPGDFLDLEILPRLFERLDDAFPEFGWGRKGRGWTATNREHTKNLGGARPDRVVCNAPFGFLVHGGTATAWTAYVNGGTTPTGRDFVDVVKKLASRAGVDASVLDREPTPEEERQARRGDLLEMFQAQAHEALLSDAGKDARAYLVERRGFEAARLEELPFGLYATPADVEARLVAAGFTADEVKVSGLLKDERWTGRLVIPWRDRWGRIGTYAARDLTGKAEEGAKYLYLSGASKPVAFGLDVALRSKEGRDHLVLLEGLVDVVSLQARGFPNVAALGGTGTSPKTFEALEDFGVRSVTLLFDNDPPGRDGTLKALDNLQKASKAPVVYVVDPSDLGDEKDPDEFVRVRGLDAFREVLKKRKSWAIYRGQVLLEEVTPSSSDNARREAAGRVLDFEENLRGERAGLDREDLLRLAAERTGYGYDTLAEVVESAAARRRREEAERRLDRVLREAGDERTKGTDALEVVRKLEEELFSLRSVTVEPPPPFSVDRLEKLSREIPEGKSSGWGSLDALEVRFNAGELAVLGARTGHGKTTVLVNLLLNWLEAAAEADSDELIVFYSAEEPEVRIYHRLLALVTGREDRLGDKWSANSVRDFLRSPDSRESWSNPMALKEARNVLRSHESRLLVVYRPVWTVDELATHARSLKDRRDVGAVLVDYLQRIPPPAGNFDRRDIEVSAVGRRLKALAVAVDAPVVVGAQINREAIPDKYATKLIEKPYGEAVSVIREARPDLHHLREGGSEQEADLVLGLLNYVADYRTEAKKRDELPAVTLLEVGTLKNRYGAVGSWAGLAFEGQFGVIREPTPAEEEALKVEPSQSREKLSVERSKELTERTHSRERSTESRSKIEESRVERERLRLETQRLRLGLEKVKASKRKPKEEVAKAVDEELGPE